MHLAMNQKFDLKEEISLRLAKENFEENLKHFLD